MQEMNETNPTSFKDQLRAEVENLPPAHQAGQSAQEFSSAGFQDRTDHGATAETANLKSCKPEESAEPAGDQLPTSDLPEEVQPEGRNAEPSVETSLPWSQAVETCIELGFPVIPVDATTDEPVVAREEWKVGYSVAKARGHFASNPGHKPALLFPEDTIAFRTQDEVARKALMKVLEDGGTAPFLQFQIGASNICFFQWEQEGRLARDLTVRQDAAGQIDLLYPGFTLKAVDPEMAIAACHVESIYALHVIDSKQMAEIHRFNRKIVTAALEGKEQPENHPLGRHSLRGQSDKIRQEMVSAVDVLPGIALRGQSTMIFAPPNTGKTLLVLHLIIQAIKAGLLEPAHLFYVNVDDNTEGLYHKLLLAERHGFHMLAEGYQGYRAQNFLDQVAALIREGVAPRTVVVLDTLKRFTDVMDKRKNSEFTGLMRQFVLKGGTVIALGHVNKKRSDKGKSTYAGTSDLLDDVDCGFIIDEVQVDRAEQRRIVEFQRIKGRGRVAEKVAFSYSVEDDQSYLELLGSVEEVDPASLEPIQYIAAMHAERPLIEAIEASIRAGQNAKMQIITGVSRATRISQRNVGSALERYTGEDPAKHRWTYQVGDRGAKLYVLLEAEQPEASD